MGDAASISGAQAAQVSLAYGVGVAQKQQNLQKLEGQDAAALIEAAGLPPRGANYSTGNLVNVTA